MCLARISHRGSGLKLRVEHCPACGEWLDTRSNEQNALLHALLTKLSRSVEWAGSKRDVETWKRLVVAAYCREKKMSANMYPALDGQGFDVVYRRTSRMSVKEVSEIIEWLYAWAADKGIEI